MELLRAYANKVASYLPAKQRESMRDEIYADLCDDFDECQTSEENFLAGKPHPMRYAGQLTEPNQGYLIGPQFYFSYLETLKGVAAVVCVVFIVLGLLEFDTSRSLNGSLLRMGSSILEAIVWNSAIVTGIFIALERGGERASWLDTWKIDSLKHWQSAQRISRTAIAFELGMAIFLLAWLLGIFEHSNFFWRGQRVEDVQLVIPDGLYWAFIALLMVDILQAVWQFFEPVWSDRKRWARIGFNLLWIIALLIAWEQPDKIQLLVTEGRGSLDRPEFQLNKIFNWALLGVAILVFWDSVDLFIKGRKGP